MGSLLMFSVLLNLRLLSLREFDDVGDRELAELVESQARALEAEADALISGEADWASIVAEAMDVDRDRIAKAEQRACRLGHALGRSSLILADQIVACLLRANAVAHGRATSHV
jgi:hypothetical protein